ncbi:SigE family RNA polymerase sigma factor [Catellatospora citrea]|uniref:SigE family RNA polymerase sigma factor n=1 Tax=Catellatospora citrea TaxID=53366 RepID=UPI0033C3C94A
MAEPATFDEFVMTRSPHLLRIAFLLIGDHALAEDLLQTALAKSWSAWRRIEGDPEPYVRQVLANTFNSWWRRRWHGERPTETLPERAGSPPQAAVDERDRVWRALARLPRQQRVVLVLRYFEDLSEAEIAQTLSISPGSVKTHAAKGLAKLRLDPSLRVLPAPESEDVPGGNERLGAVRMRIAQRRRRGMAGVAAGLAVVALIAAYALLPQLRSRALPEPAFPVELPSYAQSQAGFVDVDYYRLGPSAQHDYAARLDRALVWIPSGRQEALFATCRQRGTTGVQVTAYVNGRKVSALPCRGGHVAWESFQAALDPAALGLSPGRPAVVTLDLQGSEPGDPLPVGTVAVAIGELVQFDALPLSASAGPAVLDRAVRSVDPATITWLEAGGARSAILTWRGPLVVVAQSLSAGRLRISVDGVAISTLDFGTTPVEVAGQDGTTTTGDTGLINTFLGSGRTYLNGARFDPRPGSSITITVEAERMTGDWFVQVYPMGG